MQSWCDGLENRAASVVRFEMFLHRSILSPVPPDDGARGRSLDTRNPSKGTYVPPRNLLFHRSNPVIPFLSLRISLSGERKRSDQREDSGRGSVDLFVLQMSVHRSMARLTAYPRAYLRIFLSRVRSRPRSYVPQQLSHVCHTTLVKLGHSVRIDRTSRYLSLHLQGRIGPLADRCGR